METKRIEIYVDMRQSMRPEWEDFIKAVEQLVFKHNGPVVGPEMFNLWVTKDFS